MERTNHRADLIFADPPYDMSHELFAQIPKLVFDRNILQEDGVLIIEHSKHMELSQLPYFSSQRKYGGSVFSFFALNDTV